MLQLKMLLVDGRQQRPRIRTAAEERVWVTAGGNGPESVLELKMLLVDGEKQRSRVFG